MYKYFTTYADDITIIASHTKPLKAHQLIQPYIYKIYKWATIYNLHINTDKTTATLFTPDPGEYGTTLSLKLNNQTPQNFWNYSRLKRSAALYGGKVWCL